MAEKTRQIIALVGNPNSGKSSLFNHLTGLNQKIGNFPGVTVDRKSGFTSSPTGEVIEIVDLPGIYSIYPRSLDEKIVAEILLDHKGPSAPDKVLVIADATNLKRSFLLLTQILDLGMPTVLALNMMDLASKGGLHLDLKALSNKLGIPVVPINARNGLGLEELKKHFTAPLKPADEPVFTIWDEARKPVEEIRKRLEVDNDYEAYQFLEQPASLNFLPKQSRDIVAEVRTSHHFIPGKFQGAETILRYGGIQQILNDVTIRENDKNWKQYSNNLDKILLHKVWGYVTFFAILFLIFQSIFAWAVLPMDLIDELFAGLSKYAAGALPQGALTSLLAEGIIPGIGGILIFIPQIAILFAFIAILEESGYMTRVVFMMDKIMRKFGLNGKSVVPLMSGVACAIPAIMATRTIDNWKERTITILVTPLMSCSARLPVFTILIALIIPDQKALGFFNLQGLALMGMYLLGFIAALLSAWVMKLFIRVKERSFLIMEMPAYRIPKWSNVGYTIVEKTKAFVFEAGKVILSISIILWVLASYGPGDDMANARERVLEQSANVRLTEEGLEDRIAAYKLEHSYAGIIGKSIEPAIAPLGYDWKIGIALLTSFAAREVFVGTMATIYSIGSVDDEDTNTIKERLSAEVDASTGKPRFTPAVGLSLLIFYTFAMQCMSTIAVVYRETKGWKWPAIQLFYMTALAYISAFIVYQTLS
jgi:ferrous iron transport protein B